MSESIELQVNLNTLVRDGWCVEMETGLRGGQIRSWVKLRHFERDLSFKVRAAPQELKAALAMAMQEAGLEPFAHAPRRRGDVPPDHEFDANGKCKWCPEEQAHA